MPADYRIGRLNGRYVVTWWADGKRRRHRLDALTPKDAEREAIDVIQREKAAPTGTTIADLWQAYSEEKEGRRVAVAMKHEWNAVGPFFGHLRPDQIKIATCRAYVAHRRKTTARGKATPVHDGTIWTELGHLRTVLVWALGHDKAPRIERPQKSVPRDRFLTEEEIDRLLNTQMAYHIKLAILLMLGTAGRVTSIMELKWPQVDFERGVVDLRTSATGPRNGCALVPMNAMLRAALAEARRAAVSDHVIEWAGQPVASIKTGFNAAVKAAGLVGVSPRILRHTSAVHMAQAGVPISEIAQFLGHKSTKVTERVYGRYSPNHLRRAADVLDFTKMRKAAG